MRRRRAALSGEWTPDLNEVAVKRADEESLIRQNEGNKVRARVIERERA